jgi:hypothetical protein
VCAQYVVGERATSIAAHSQQALERHVAAQPEQGSGPILGAHCMLESPIMAEPSFDITCPRCGHKFQEATKRLLDNLSVICPGCGGEIDVKLGDEHGLETTTEVGSLQVKQGVRGSVSYSVEVQNRGLNKHRLIRGPDPDVIKAKVLCQVAEWNEQWAKRAAAKRQMTMAERRKEEVSHKHNCPVMFWNKKCGGLLLDRHEPPLTRRFVVYYCSAVYSRPVTAVRRLPRMLRWSWFREISI